MDETTTLKRDSCSQDTGLNPMPNHPLVSVIVTLYTTDQIDDLRDCLDGLVEQTYENAEFYILPETEPVVEEVNTVVNEYNDDRIIVSPIENMSGLSDARNTGAEKANGDIIAFLDVDAVPTREWVAELVAPYVEYDLFAVGGKAIPIWEDTESRPKWIPTEFDWLVGSNHDEFGSEGDFVRNTYGCNISFRRDVFLELGGYDTELGKSHGFNLQGEEPSFGIKLQQKYGTAVYYQPKALIHHKVDKEQQELRWLIRRAFLQGVSKQVIDSKFNTDDTPLKEEDEYLKFVLLNAFPSHLLKAVKQVNYKHIFFAIMIVIYTGCVATGFFYSKIFN